MNTVMTVPEWLQQSTAASNPSALAWLSLCQRNHWEAFIEKGLPTRKDERWKYSDLSFLANKNFSVAPRIEPILIDDVIQQHRLQQCESIMLVFANGYFMPTLSDLTKLPDGVIACSIGDALLQHPELLQQQLADPIDASLYPFASLNVAMFNDGFNEGLFFYLPDNITLEQPLHLLSLVTTEAEFIAHPHHVLVLGENSKLVLAEEHYSQTTQTYLMNVVTTISVGVNATLEHVKIQHAGKQAVHMAHTFIRQRQDSHVSFTDFAVGATFARDEIVVKLLEAGAECRTGGYYRLYDDNQYIDHHIEIDHIAPRSKSEMLYKGILDNKSRAVFNGRLHVAPDAQKILAYQANHNLLLSNNAEVYSKPELEIYADDVKCKHGATIGQLDQEALFYMRSRGIEYADAMNILLQGFAEDVLQNVTHSGIKLRVQELL